MEIFDPIVENVVAENVAFEAYLRDFDGQHAEWEDGKVILMSPVSDRHDKLTGFIYAVLDAYLESTGEGQVRGEKFTMKLAPRKAREPDAMVITTANLGKLKPTYLDGAADLVVEVISEESYYRDKALKFLEYEEFGVREYWLIDPLREEALFYVRSEDGRYKAKSLDEQGYYHCTVLPRLIFEAAILIKPDVPGVRGAVALVDKMLEEKSS